MTLNTINVGKPRQSNPAWLSRCSGITCRCLKGVVALPRSKCGTSHDEQQVALQLQAGSAVEGSSAPHLRMPLPDRRSPHRTGACACRRTQSVAFLSLRAEQSASAAAAAAAALQSNCKQRPTARLGGCICAGGCGSATPPSVADLVFPPISLPTRCDRQPSHAQSTGMLPSTNGA